MNCKVKHREVILTPTSTKLYNLQEKWYTNLELIPKVIPWNSQVLNVKLSYKISYKNLLLDQDNNLYGISLRILITSLLDNVLML